eukprot:jgi/Chlat1/3241/Chrsp22S03424
MVGRVLGGVATSLLFSAFESWLVAEHFKRNFDGQWLSTTSSSAIFLGNGLAAILAGLLANFLVSHGGLGPVISFDTAVCSKARCTPLCSRQQDLDTAQHGVRHVHVGMHSSSLASRLMARYTPEKYMQSVFLISSVALLVPIVVKRVPGLDPVFTSHMQLVGFLCFKACVGVLWPSVMRMLASYVPEERRATILKLFRIPLNLFVCIVLYNVTTDVSKFKLTSISAMCAAFLFLTAVCQRRLATLAEKTKFIASPHHVSEDDLKQRLLPIDDRIEHRR